MMEVDDTVIKLFGKKITLPDNGRYSAGESSTATVDHENSSPHHDCILLKISKAACLDDKKVDRVVEEEAQKDHLSKESTNSKPLPESDDNHPKTPSIDEEIETLKPPKTENDPTNSEKKTLKKPDKILPCPRCNSTDTKFCYYNNYNINQPRHFCKSCQRYWTSGGTMRNVPVGAGRRKYKNPASYCLHNHIHNIVSDEALEAALVHAPNGIVHAPNGILRPNFKPNGTVLSFNLGSQLCESMACVLGLAEKMAPNGTQNGIYKLEQGILVEEEENGNDFSSVSSITSSKSMMEGVRKGIQEPRMQNIHGFPSRVQCFPGVPWPCPWNSTVPVSGIPIPFYASPYWNCTIPGTSIQAVPNSGLKSPALGKHSRNGDLINRINPKVEDKNCERPILVPRTLRIDDPDDAAKSSIWETLGIKNDSMCRGTFFKASQPKGEHVTTEASPVLQANPAAMSRSLSFQERA